MNLLPFERIKREKLVRKEAQTSDKFGKRPQDRTVDELIDLGIVNINKPKGPTSHQVSAYAKKILNVAKSGHSGTLDPKVTGVLPIAFGRGTRIVQALLPSGKEYIAIMHLHKEVPEDKIRAVCKEFTGKIKQLPPIKSSVKREWRFRKVYYIDIIEIDDKDVLMRIGCQAGTYIRKLLHDMGDKLGCGAHMAELIRTKAGPFTDNDMWTLQDLTDAYWFWKNEGDESFIRKVVRPVEFGVSHLPRVWVLDTTVDSLSHGADLKVPGVAAVESEIQAGELIAVMTLKDELVGFGEARMISKEMVKEERGVAVSVHKVFLQPGTYPRIERSKD